MTVMWPNVNCLSYVVSTSTAKATDKGEEFYVVSHLITVWRFYSILLLNRSPVVTAYGSRNLDEHFKWQYHDIFLTSLDQFRKWNFKC